MKFIVLILCDFGKVKRDKNVRGEKTGGRKLSQ